MSLTVTKSQHVPVAAAGGNSTISLIDNNCQWTIQLQPATRTDGWGLGWLNLHTIEAMEVATSDAMEVL